MNKTLLLLLGAGCMVGALQSQGTDLPPLKPNDIKGTIRFNNVSPDILALLTDIKKLSPVYNITDAASKPPYNVSAEKGAVLTGGATLPYAITVKGSNPGIPYTVYQRVDLGPGDYATQYYFGSKTSPPVLDTDTPVTLNFEECAGAITVRWLSVAGTPVIVKDAQISISDTPNTHQLAGVIHLPAPATQHTLLAEGVGPIVVSVSYQVEVPGFTDTLSYSTSFEAASNCDQVTELTVTVPDVSGLGKVIGLFDIVGETEVPVPGYLGSPAISYVQLVGGEAGTSRTHSFLGKPSSGPFELPNVLATGADPDALGYKLQGLAYLRAGKNFAVLRTPALAEGSNPSLKVAPSETVDTGSLLTIKPGHLTGRVELKGPLPTVTYKPLSKYMTFGWQTDADHDGVPDDAYAVGVGNTFVESQGVDARAPGADYSAADGYAATSFDASYTAATSLMEGNFDLEMGGLKSQASIWGEPKLRYEIANGDGTIPDDYIYQQARIQQKGALGTVPKLTVEAGITQELGHDLSYCLSEVCIHFRSLGDPLYYPRVYGTGAFDGVDYRGVTLAYGVELDYSVGTPANQAAAAQDALVIVYLPEGDYTLLPYVEVSNVGGDSNVGLEPFTLHVGRGERICVGTDLAVDVTAPTCSSTESVTISGQVNTGNNVVKLTIAGEDGKETVIGENLGANPTFTTSYALPNIADCGVNQVTITATDSTGGTASRTVTIHFDNTPPVITCPADITTGTAPGLETATVNFAVVATDACSSPVKIVCVPPSGSAFPVGDTMVHCTATDPCGNQSVCSFKVTVIGSGGHLPPTIRCPGNIKMPCHGARGTTVDFSVVAVGDGGGPVTVVCTPPSGSVFGVGTTTVECVATDSSGASSRCSFTVTVEPGSLTIRKTVTIEWCGGGTLQYGDNLDGSWTDIPGATSPYTVDVNQTHRFYRARF